MYNMDFSKRIVIYTNEEEWIESPASGVRRIPLEREETESGHTTSAVEYLPGACFKKHFHPKGEEIFVLEGVFSDERGNYRVGAYIRNPAGTSHVSFSKEGCRIFVRFNQIDPRDLDHVVSTLMKWTGRTGMGN